jgi:hypothetical protein
MPTITTYRKSGRLCILRVNAFDEKAGRSQVESSRVESSVFAGRLSLRRVATVATFPSALFYERFSLGASWCVASGFNGWTDLLTTRAEISGVPGSRFLRRYKRTRVQNISLIEPNLYKYGTRVQNSSLTKLAIAY